MGYAKKQKCRDCGGVGKQIAIGPRLTWVICRFCNGTGSLAEAPK